MQSLFTSDKYFEEVIARFLDSYFYRYLFTENKYIVARAQNKDLQKKGIDVVVINTDGKKVTYIDEKCAAHYVNSKLKTFAFEITGTDGNPGWLIKDDMLTDYFLLIWVHANEEKYPQQEKGWNRYYETAQIEDIEYITCCFIKKERLIKYLGNKGLDKTSLYEQAMMMREKKCTIDEKNGYWFTYSYKNLREGPVNILISKEELQTLATNEHGCFCYKVNAPKTEDKIVLINYNG